MPPFVNIESIHIPHIAPSGTIAACEDFTNGNPATDIVSMENFRDIIFVIIKNAGAVGTATYTIESCDDTSATTTTAISFRYKSCTTIDTFGAWTYQSTPATGLTTGATADAVYMVHINSSELSGTNKYVRMQCTEVDSTAQDGMIMCIMLNPRDSQSVTATVLT